MKKSPLVPILVLGVLLAAVQVIASAAGRDYYLTQLIMSAYYSIVVMGLCLVMGYAGQISLGHGAFFAIGGYTSAALTTRDIPAAHDASWGNVLQNIGILDARQGLYGDPLITVSPGAAFMLALVLAVLIAFLIGWPALRLRGHYLAMATLGFGLIVYRLVLGTEFLGAADGISGVPPWEIGFGIVLSERRAYRVVNYYFAWGMALFVLLLLLNLVRSRLGRALRSIHGDEQAANAMGVNTSAYKLQAFILSAALAAAAGSFLTHYSRGIGPSEAGAMKSVRYVALVAAGGMANLWGVLFISGLLNFLSLRGFFGTLDHAAFGLILITIVSLAPEGPLEPIGRWLRLTGKSMFAHRNTPPADG